MKRFTLVTAVLVALLVIAQSTVVRAAQIKVLCSNGIRAVMEELLPRFEQETKHGVAITYGLAAVLKRQIDAGERFDLAVLTPPLVDELIKAGRIAPDTRAVVARSGMGLMVRAGAAKPDIRTTEAVTRTLAGARAIAFAREGASGVFFTGLINKLSLADRLTSNLRPTTTGEEVAAAVARGDAELGVLPVSEILPAPGVELLGTFPADIQGYVVMVAGVSAGAAQGDAARELVKFLMSPSALPVITKKGMER